jgi:hypothetical protein
VGEQCGVADHRERRTGDHPGLRDWLRRAGHALHLTNDSHGSPGTQPH